MSKHINMSGLKTLLEPLVHLINKKAERPDWNENDASSPSYITNRPFYEENNVKEIVSKTTVLIDEDMGYKELSPMEDSFVVGQIYKVVLNNVEYECIAWSIYDDCICIGNGNIYGGEGLGNDEPFSCDSYSGGEVYLNTLIAGSYTISIYKKSSVIHKIDEKYLPDSLTTQEKLNEALKQSQSNWNTQETSDPSYIHGKTHYYSNYYEILPFTEVRQSLDGWGGLRGGHIEEGYHDISTENIYNILNNFNHRRVHFGDKAYDFDEPLDNMGSEGSSTTWFVGGNKYLYTGDESMNNGLPFFVGLMTIAKKIVFYWTDGKWSHDFALEVYTPDYMHVKQLDEMYIPDTIARTDDLPVAITSERITEICGIAPMLTFSVNENGDALMNAGWPDDNGNIQI